MKDNCTDPDVLAKIFSSHGRLTRNRKPLTLIVMLLLLLLHPNTLMITHSANNYTSPDDDNSDNGIGSGTLGHMTQDSWASCPRKPSDPKSLSASSDRYVPALHCSCPSSLSGDIKWQTVGRRVTFTANVFISSHYNQLTLPPFPLIKGILHQK